MDDITERILLFPVVVDKPMGDNRSLSIPLSYVEFTL